MDDGRAEAWDSVVDVVEEYDPKWYMLGENGRDCIVTYIRNLNTNLATARGALEDFAEHDCTYPDAPCLAVHISKLSHGMCDGCKARAVLASLPHPAPSATEGGTKDNNRCAICGWPLKDKAEDGCIRGNCSQRPAPAHWYDVDRALHERNAVISGTSPATGEPVGKVTQERLGDDPKSFQKCMEPTCNARNYGQVILGWLCPAHYRQTVAGISPPPANEVEVALDLCGASLSNHLPFSPEERKVAIAFARAHAATMTAERDRLREDLATNQRRLEDALNQCRCPDCGCGDQVEAESNECGCDSPVCARDGSKTLAQHYLDAVAQLKERAQCSGGSSVGGEGTSNSGQLSTPAATSSGTSSTPASSDPTHQSQKSSTLNRSSPDASNDQKDATVVVSAAVAAFSPAGQEWTTLAMLKPATRFESKDGRSWLSTTVVDGLSMMCISLESGGAGWWPSNAQVRPYAAALARGQGAPK